MNSVRKSQVRRFLLGFLTGSAGVLIGWVVALLGRPLLPASFLPPVECFRVNRNPGAIPRAVDHRLRKLFLRAAGKEASIVG